MNPYQRFLDILDAHGLLPQGVGLEEFERADPEDQQAIVACFNAIKELLAE